MLKVGIFGAGHLGKIHIQQWLTIPGVEVVGFYDPNDENANAVIEKFGIKRYTIDAELIDAATAIDIVTPTLNHYDVAKACLLKSKHIFIEKPLTHTIDEAAALVKLVEEARVKCQVGHVERYNPAFQALNNYQVEPMFIESHRLAKFNPRGTDVSVILDLMIHDIDIILSLVKSKVKRISASGVAVVSSTPDIANARIEFDNGCVANLTSSRISLKNMRKTRIFQKDAYISVDFLDKKTEFVRLQNDPNEDMGIALPIDLGTDEKKYISIHYPNIQETNAIQQELADFTLAILTDAAVKVPIYDGYAAMITAHQILEKINNGLRAEA